MLQQLTQFAAEEAEKSEEGIAALGLDPAAILFQAGTFLILFFLIKKYALQKIVDGLEGRRQKIEESLKTAEEIEKRDRENRQETEKLLKEARAQADEVLAKAHEESGSIIKAAESVAGAKAEKMIADSQSKMKADIQKAKIELKSEMLSLVAEATETVINEKLDERKDHALLEKALKGDG